MMGIWKNDVPTKLGWILISMVVILGLSDVLFRWM